MTTTVRHPAAALALMMALIASLVVLPTATPAAEASVDARQRTSVEQAAEARMFDRHNVARTSPGTFGYGQTPSVSTLRWAEDVAQVARAWSDTMAATSDFRHNPSYTSQVCCWTNIGENIAYYGPYTFQGGTAESAADLLMQMWMDSTGHRNNIMRSAFTQVGIGVSIDQNDRMWATAVFRTPTSNGPQGTTTYPGGSNNPTPPPVDPPDARDDTNACPTDGTVPDAGFRDVADPDRRRAVNCLAWWGVTEGLTPTTYGPLQNIRRDQMASFIARAIEKSGGQLPTPTRNHFPDVPANSPHGEAINKLAEAGVIGGYADGTFGPLRQVTRAQMSRFLVAGFEHRTGETLPAPSKAWFRDVGSGGAAAPVNQMADAGWASGYNDGTYRPTNPVRRDHMALFVTRWLSHLAEDGHIEANPA